MAFDAHEWGRRWSPGSGPTKGDDIAALYADGASRWDPAIGSRLTDRTAIAAFADAFLAAIPDAVVEVRSVTADASTVVVEWTWRGTHHGDMENWPARGEAILLNGVNVISVDGDLIAGENSYWDAGELFGRGT